jgi:hypothetical protein
VVQLVDKRNVTALMTAESIIVGFLVTYGVTINDKFVSLTRNGEPIFGTVLAGFLISALAITAFQSIYLLYRSIDISISDLNDLKDSDKRYKAGYDLFLMVLAGSGLYVVMNAYSIIHYAVIGANVPDIEPLYISIAGSFLVAWLWLVVFTPLELTDCVRRTRSKLGDWHFGFLIFLLVGDMVEVEVLILQPSLLKEWWSWLIPIAFAVATVVESRIASVRWKRINDTSQSKSNDLATGIPTSS